MASKKLCEREITLIRGRGTLVLMDARLRLESTVATPTNAHTLQLRAEEIAKELRAMFDLKT